jgi:putative ABC transport system substrate-binding protein
VISTELADGIDAFWLLPDPTVITPETLATLQSLGFQNKLPILAFADKYLSYGAVVSVSFDVYAMGEQAGEMVRQILTGTNVNEIPVTPAKKIKVKFNEDLLRISGL